MGIVKLHEWQMVFSILSIQLYVCVCVISEESIVNQNVFFLLFLFFFICFFFPFFSILSTHISIVSIYCLTHIPVTRY